VCAFFLYFKVVSIESNPFDIINLLSEVSPKRWSTWTYNEV